jgi:murein DD-endopeptidase MepM/ murein hydrolase activator NlpD
MINHGWGVYTAYMHQSEILVKVGDIVKAGQLIGQVGRTGLRITGPHLHLEVWVGGIQVDPIDWLSKEFP